MPDINDHMDELFQKASENYPLKTTQGNFDDLIPFLTGPATLTGSVNPAALKHRYTALLLALLLIGGCTVTYLIYNHSNNQTIEANVKQANKTQVGNETTLSNAQTSGNLTSVLNSSNTLNLQQPLEVSDNTFLRSKMRGNTASQMKVDITGSAADDMNDSFQTDETGLFSSKNKNPITSVQQLKITISNPGTENLDETDKENKKEEADKPTSSKPDKKKRAKPSIYFGIGAGAALNQVKGQHSTKPGLSTGLILGLEVNKKLSFETGVQITQKKYYAQGKYFTPKNGAMPPDMKVTSLTGTSTFIEVPVSIKYDFSKKKNGFYAKAGVSTYLMTKESNSYKSLISGQPQDINSTYKSTSYYPAAQLNIGGGYQQSLGKKINIRVEPYIQIPLRGMGIGSLPVTTTGVQLILTRN
ncbi:MAG: outer membrane beta-barrel protein [Ferruginibacter sp.]